MILYNGPNIFGCRTNSMVGKRLTDVIAIVSPSLALAHSPGNITAQHLHFHEMVKESDYVERNGQGNGFAL